MHSSSQTSGKRSLFNPEQHTQLFYFGPAQSDADDDEAISVKERSIVKGCVDHHILYVLAFDWSDSFHYTMNKKVAIPLTIALISCNRH